MKKLIVLLLVASTAFASCTEDDEIFEPIEQEPAPVEPDPEDSEDPEEPAERFVLKPRETRNYMVDPAATDETVALFYHLKTISKSHFIVGQQDAFNAFYSNNAGESDIKKTTGSDPGLLGSDFMFITDDNNNGQSNNWFYRQEKQIVGDAVEAYNKGMINHFTWHLREPYEGDHFYASEMTQFQRENAFKSILPGGANHEYYKEKLQKVAEVVLDMRGTDGTLAPVIFRPFHEFDGNWFWWGPAYTSAQDFKTGWRFTVEYLRDELGVHNLLYAYAPDNSYTSSTMYLQRYPGDAYVDVLGMDNYGDLKLQDGTGVSAANAKLKMLSDLALEKVKISAMTETGYFMNAQNPFPNNFYTETVYPIMTNNDVEIGFVMFWQNSTDTYTVPPPGEAGEADFLEFIQKDEPLLLEQMEDFYSLPGSL